MIYNFISLIKGSIYFLNDMKEIFSIYRSKAKQLGLSLKKCPRYTFLLE